MTSAPAKPLKTRRVSWPAPVGRLTRACNEYFEDNALALYNLASDLGESTNLAEKHPDTVKKLHARMRVWRKQTGAFVPGELNPKYRPPDLKSD